MKYAIIWTWMEPDATGKLQPKQKVGYFCTLDEARAAFDRPVALTEKELVCIIETSGQVPD